MQKMDVGGRGHEEGGAQGVERRIEKSLIALSVFSSAIEMQATAIAPNKTGAHRAPVLFEVLLLTNRY